MGELAGGPAEEARWHRGAAGGPRQQRTNQHHECGNSEECNAPVVSAPSTSSSNSPTGILDGDETAAAAAAAAAGGILEQGPIIAGDLEKQKKNDVVDIDETAEEDQQQQPHIIATPNTANRRGVPPVATTAAEAPRQRDAGGGPAEGRRYRILALYQFVAPPASGATVRGWRIDAERGLRHLGVVRGSVIFGPEGVNGTLCYPHEDSHSHNHTTTTTIADDAGGMYDTNHAAVVALFAERFDHLKTRLSYSAAPVFHRLQVRIKPEIVTLRLPLSPPFPSNDEAAVSSWSKADRAGTYVAPGAAWDALVRDEDCLVVDVRNAYEVELGTFEGAVHANCADFAHFPAWLAETLLLRRWRYDGDNEPPLRRAARPNKIAMFCTGGIRCEKSTALCLQLLRQQQHERDGGDDVDNLPSVYHLEGGILAHLDQEPEPASSTATAPTWSGECFVFDQRVAVTRGLRPTTNYALCYACRRPTPLVPRDDEGGNSNNNYVPGICCPACCNDDDDSPGQHPSGNPQRRRRQRHAERQRQIDLAAARRLGPHLHDAKQRAAVVGGEK